MFLKSLVMSAFFRSLVCDWYGQSIGFFVLVAIAVLIEYLLKFDFVYSVSGSKDAIRINRMVTLVSGLYILGIFFIGLSSNVVDIIRLCLICSVFVYYCTFSFSWSKKIWLP